jgi:uncharacterized membrane protein YfhO
VLTNLDARPRTFVAHGAGSVTFLQDGAETVSLVARMQRPGLVVLADQFTPGWSVSVDGRAADPRRYDSVLRAVDVTAGRHVIVWSYRTPGLVVGAALSLTGVALASIWLTAPWRRWVRRRKSPETRGDGDARAPPVA